jgi:hypothetical protein
MMKKYIEKAILFVLPFLPVSFVYAQTKDFKSFAGRVVELLNQVSAFLMSLALLVFIIGVIRFIASAGDDKSRADGRQMMVWGTIALFVMVGVWGLVALINTTFLG